jgi:hypothetical protein
VEVPYIPDVWKPALRALDIGGLTPVPHNMSSGDFLNETPAILNRYFLSS